MIRPGRDAQTSRCCAFYASKTEYYDGIGHLFQGNCLICLKASTRTYHEQAMEGRFLNLYQVLGEVMDPARRVPMPRAPRLHAPGDTAHAMAPCNNRKFPWITAENSGGVLGDPPGNNPQLQDRPLCVHADVKPLPRPTRFRCAQPLALPLDAL